MKNLQSIGRMAIFYIPVQKLTEHPETQKWLEESLIHLYGGFTKITQNIEGHFQMGHEIIKDEHVRYEVSFNGKKRIPAFVKLVAKLAGELGEEAVYLTMGEKSYLVSRT